VRIVFMGSPEFALPALRRLIESEHEIALVVTQPDRPAGRRRALRPPPAKDLALAHGLEVFQPERVNAAQSLERVRAAGPDALIIAAYGQILKQPLLDIPRRGALNIHASLLPKYRGASPVAAAILAGEEVTGVSIIEVVLALDAGPVLGQRTLPITRTDTTGTLTEKLATLGADLLIGLMPAWERRELAAQPQDDEKSTYAPLVRREDAVIDWRLSAKDVWLRVRAYNPWPVATTTVEGASLRILEAWPLDVAPPGEPGLVAPLPADEVLPQGAGFIVGCGSGVLAVMRAQRAGKRPVSGTELLRGWRDLIGKRFGP
jgi:methionyl-tRNA formyltransferase